MMLQTTSPIGMEACSGRIIGRVGFQAMGHEVRLMLRQSIQPAWCKAWTANPEGFEGIQTYIANDAATILNYAEWHRCGERVSTGFF